jgi:Zn-dependent metalloprotease
MRIHFMAAVILLTAGVSPAVAEQRSEAERSRSIDWMIASTDAEVRVHPITGTVRNARFSAGRVAADAQDAQTKAESFLLRHGRAFGIDAPASQLELERDSVDRVGHQNLVYGQVHDGVPVFGGRLAIHFDETGELIAATSSVLPDIGVSTVVPSLSAARAEDIARSIAAKHHGVAAGDLSIAESELVVFNDGIAWGLDGRDHLTWRVEVTNFESIAEHVFIDADDGRLRNRITGVEHIRRQVYENSGSNLIWTEGDPLPYEGSGPFRDEEINNLITVAEQTYNTFFNLSGGEFLSWTGDDGTMVSVYDRSGDSCPNAYFNGSSTTYCVGTATDDIIAHEWTHGYTRSTHGLVYQWQSGALNESYSDIFGEVVDLLYDSGTDDPSSIRDSGTCSAATTEAETELIVLEPASISGPFNLRGATFNPSPPWSVTAEVELADDGVGTGTDACDELVGFTPGKIAMVTMANCDERFVTPATNAQAAGAVGVIVVNPINNNVTTMTGPGRLDIPSVILGKDEGNLLRDAIADGLQVTLKAGGDGSLRWLVGEDSSAFGGAIRDMWNPECLGDPGRVFSPAYYCGTGDNGGVHSNSGVPNHAFALLMDGGTSNGVTVPAIGMTRAAHIYWRAMSVYQTPLSDLREHAELLAASCQDLIGAPLPDLVTGQVSPEVVTADTCAAIEAAMTATEMKQWPTQCNFATILDPDAPDQPTTIVVLDERFDTQPNDWTLTNQGVFAEYIPRDWVWTQNLPNDRQGGAFYAENDPELGNCQEGSDDQSGVVHLDSPAIELPLGTRPVVLFDHYIATEERVDGGNLKISVNGGPFEVVPSEAFLFNPYNDTLRLPQWNDNPMAGEEAFVGTNDTTFRGSWGQSQVHLGGIAQGGDTIVLRFDFGTDGCLGQDGWYIDNVKLVMEPRERQGGQRIAAAP